MANKRSFFNLDGSIREGLTFGDPYRDATGSGTVGGDHFDDDGWPSDDLLSEADAVCKEGTARPLSVAAQIVHACEFAGSTKGNYSPVYMWRY